MVKNGPGIGTTMHGGSLQWAAQLDGALLRPNATETPLHVCCNTFFCYSPLAAVDIRTISSNTQTQKNSIMD